MSAHAGSEDALVTYGDIGATPVERFAHMAKPPDGRAW